MEFPFSQIVLGENFKIKLNSIKPITGPPVVTYSNVCVCMCVHDAWISNDLAAFLDAEAA